LFAIIDIETTGGRPQIDKITEIAIVLHDGFNVIERFSTLVNPGCPIPSYIANMTGISNDMVKSAPRFHEVAKKIVEMTENTFFVAHNVRFDYGFIKAAFLDLGYEYERKTICTVRMSRRTFKGLPSYSLGRLCESLNIQLYNRHRALGDAEATAILFDQILKHHGNQIDKTWLSLDGKKKAKK